MTRDQFHCRYCGSDLADRHDVVPGDTLTCSECDAVFEIFSDHEEYGPPIVTIDCLDCDHEHEVEYDEGQVGELAECPDCGAKMSFDLPEIEIDPDRGHPKFEVSIRATKPPRPSL